MNAYYGKEISVAVFLIIISSGFIFFSPSLEVPCAAGAQGLVWREDNERGFRNGTKMDVEFAPDGSLILDIYEFNITRNTTGADHTSNLSFSDDGSARLATKPGWWNEQWRYRQTIDIDNTLNAGNLTDFQMAFNLSYNDKIESDFRDLRFTWYDDDTGSEREISYWMEDKTDYVSARIWIEVPHVPANGIGSVYMYYGNPHADPASNAPNTFIFYDDFENSAVGDWVIPYGWGVDKCGTHMYGTVEKDGTKCWWQYVASWANDPPCYYGRARIYRQTVPMQSWVFEGSILTVNSYDNTLYERWEQLSFGPSSAISAIRHQDSAHVCYIGSSGAQPFIWEDDTWYDFRITYDGNVHKLYLDNVLRASWTHPGDSADKFYFGSGYFGKNYYDNALLRKYIEHEPVLTPGLVENRYVRSGEVGSENILAGHSVKAVNSIIFNASSVPAATNIMVSFSPDNDTWYNSAGEEDSWDVLEEGVNTVNLSLLNASGSNFHYRAKITSDGIETPVLNDIELQCTQYPETGTYVSSVHDAQVVTNWEKLYWESTEPLNTTISIETRVGDEMVPDNNWTLWRNQTNNTEVMTLPGRFIQYRAAFTTHDTAITPGLYSVTLIYNNKPDMPVPLTPLTDIWLSTACPTFSWSFTDSNPTDGQSSFEVEIDDNNSFLLIDNTSGEVYSANNSWAPGGDLPDGIWYWRVRTRDDHDAWSEWSTHNTLKIDTVPPLLIDKSNETVENGTRAVFMIKAIDTDSGVQNITLFWRRTGNTAFVQSSLAKISPDASTNTYSTGFPVMGSSDIEYYVTSSDHAHPPNTARLPEEGHSTMTVLDDTEKNDTKPENITDTDEDGLPDVWELKWFGNLTYGAGDDPDRDGQANGEEYGSGTTPHLMTNGNDPGSREQSDEGKPVWLWAVIGVVVLIMVLLIFIILARKKRRTKKAASPEGKEERKDFVRSPPAEHFSDTTGQLPSRPPYSYSLPPEFSIQPEPRGSDYPAEGCGDDYGYGEYEQPQYGEYIPPGSEPAPMPPPTLEPSYTEMQYPGSPQPVVLPDTTKEGIAPEVVKKLYPGSAEVAEEKQIYDLEGEDDNEIEETGDEEAEDEGVADEEPSPQEGDVLGMLGKMLEKMPETLHSQGPARSDVPRSPVLPSPPPSVNGAHAAGDLCLTCGEPLTYIEKKGIYYCNTCKLFD